MNDVLEASSTRPYLIRALYEWCTDNGFTPYLAVSVNEGVQVPFEFVQNGEIVLNIGLDATSALKLGNDFIEFKARFSGTAREIMVPVEQVMAIYARENGQGMSFPLLAPKTAAIKSSSEAARPAQLSRVVAKKELGDLQEPTPPLESPRTPPGTGRPALKRVK
jgi:stringent starvation protein B